MKGAFFYSLAKAAAAELQESTARAAATHATPPPAIQISAADVKYRHKAYLNLDRERQAREAYYRADKDGNTTPFVRLVNGRTIKRRRHLTPRAEREIRQLRTGHHPLIRTMYTPDMRALSTAERARTFRPCPICGSLTTSPVLHLFKACADDATAPFRLAMRNQVEHRNKGGFPNAADELWCTLFEYPELALAYLQRAGVLPHYTILASSASEPELQSTQSVLDAASDISSQAEDMSDEQTVESQQPEGDLVMVAEADDWRL